jgi:rhamnulokinase
MSRVTVAAVDLGAESGRVTAAHFDGRRIDLDIVRRFDNTPVRQGGWLHWDVGSLWSEIAGGLDDLGARESVVSVGVDSWGVDYGLYDRGGDLLGDPVAYRDEHRVDEFRRALAAYGPETLYSAGGVQLMEIGSLYGLLGDARSRPDLFARADRLLMMPDVFHRLLAGSTVTERTVASTTGMVDLVTGGWATGLLDRLGLPAGILPELVPAGTDVGVLRGALASRGLARTRVVVPAAHDTASAVLAVPDTGADTLFVSSGTWSLVGVVLDAPIVTEASRIANLTNEGGYDGTVRFLRNVMGLWMLQECRRHWRAEGVDVDYETLVRLAEAEPPLRSVIHLDATEFLAPGNMPDRVRSYCERHGIAVPDTMGRMARTVIDSLALSYRLVLEDIEAVTGVAITSISVVGGGGRNTPLQQATASATGRPVTVWAGEATAMGNAAAQLHRLGELGSVAEIREVTRASTRTRSFLPADTDRWDAGARRLRSLERAESRRRGLEENSRTTTGPEETTGREDHRRTEGAESADALAP